MSQCSDKLHEWEKTSNKPFEYEGSAREPMYLYHCLNCEETKIDF